jgi:signal transduction histidine kinase
MASGVLFEASAPTVLRDSMKLQVHLLLRIIATALLCLLVTASLLLYRSDRQARLDAWHVVDNVGRQLELQLLKWGATLRLDNPFPDFGAWQPDALGAGDCVVFDAEKGQQPRRFCNGVESATAAVPVLFEDIYRLFFIPGQTASRPVVFHKHRYGLLTAVPSGRRELAEAWTEINSLMTLSMLMVGTVCALVYWNVSRALAPSRLIVAGLEDMEHGNLSHRLPPFQLEEWRSIGEAINHLAAAQQQLLAERRDLAVKLMRLQEDERRDLARELHDEFGQCLAAINALTLSIAQGAQDRCPELALEAERIGEISQRLLDGIRRLLCRLRPAELDELGLEASLNSLIAAWRTTHRGQTTYALAITGNCALLPETLSTALFRSTQEALTNVAKHAGATRVSIELNVTGDDTRLRIADNGRATEVPGKYGVGLLGMRERIGALQGRLELRLASPQGLVVDIRVPSPVAEEEPT